ncbi:hypothetical protein RMATCC62417_14717 [Rhizopus microsporus]|nr:hypothetical protein RMATCC62417_14717 [Rhizopus microsporus]
MKILHLWSISYKQEGIFDLRREANVQIKPGFKDKGNLVPGLIQFCWVTKGTMEEFIGSTVALKNTQDSTKAKYLYSVEKPETVY